MSYKYGGMRAHRKGLGPLGFRMIETTDNQTEIVTHTVYNQRYPFIGMPLSTVQVNKDGQVISESVNTFAQITTEQGGIFPYIASSIEKRNQPGSDGELYEMATTITENTYDGWGNTTNLVIKTLDNADILLTQQTTATFGAKDSYEQRKGRLLSSTTKQTAKDGSQHSQISNFTYYAENETCEGFAQKQGMLKSTTIHHLTTTSCYNPFGQKIKETQAGKLNDGDTNVTHLSTSAVYSNDGRFIHSATNVLGLTTTYVYNELNSAYDVLGVVTQSQAIDHNNIAATSYLDHWGTTIAQITAGAPVVTTKTAYCDNECTLQAKYFVQTDQAGGPTTTIEYDKFGRQVASKTMHFDGGWVYRFKDYDKYGRIVREYLPTRESSRGAALTDYNQYNYDAYGRVVSMDLANHNDEHYVRPTTVYQGLNTTTTDALGKKAIEKRNKLDQLVEVTTFINELPVTLKYTYNVVGNLLSAKKTDINSQEIEQITNTDDAAGRKLTTVNLNSGSYRYRYNDFAQLIEQNNGNGNCSVSNYRHTISQIIRHTI